MQYLRYKYGPKRPTVPRDADHIPEWNDYLDKNRKFEDKKSYWGDIGENPTSKELLSQTSDGKIKISLATSRLLSQDAIGGPRLSSKKFFRGGLFVFDVEQVPRGCGLWPALWLNGFVGGREQFHMTGDPKLDKESMDKILLTMGVKTEGYKNLEGVFNHACIDKNDAWMDVADQGNFRDVPNQILSTYAGKRIYPMPWPGGGEVDILEEQNFSTTGLLSLHGGPNCQVSFPKGLLRTDSRGANNDGSIGKDLQQGDEGVDLRSRLQLLKWPDDSLRSVCGGSTCKNNANKRYDGLKDDNGNTDFSTIWNDQNPMPQEEIPNCNSAISGASGDAQIIVPDGFGKNFNANKGGVYAVHWIPKVKMYIYFWPRNIFSEEELKANGGPLSYEPKPDDWTVYQKGVRVLVGPYILNGDIHSEAITEACDFNFQAIILNITVGGGWAGGYVNNPNSSDCTYANKIPVTPENPLTRFGGPVEFDTTGVPIRYGTANTIGGGYDLWRNYIFNCVADVPVLDEKNMPRMDNGRVIKSREYNQCVNGPPDDNILGKEADFIIRGIKVFQNPDTDDTLW